MEYGYARVSSREQNLTRQIEALEAAGIEKRYIFTDKQSGKDFNRRSYNLLTGTPETAALLREGDLLTICSIDRLGRNYEEVLQQWKRITHEMKCDIRVLDMPLLDTRANGRDLDGRFVADLVLQILSYVAEKERSFTRSRQRQGLDCMPVKDGKRVSLRTGNAIGRPPVQYPENWEEVYSSWKAGKITAVVAMIETGLKKNSFYKLAKRYETMLTA